MRCLTSDTGQCGSFRGIGNVHNKWSETKAKVASVIAHPGSSLGGGLQGGGHKVKTGVDKTVFQDPTDVLLDANKFGDRDQCEKFEGMR